MVPVVPPKSNRVDPWRYDGALYKKRNEIERLFRRLKPQGLPPHLLPLRETGLRVPRFPLLRSYRRSAQIVLTRPSWLRFPTIHITDLRHAYNARSATSLASSRMHIPNTSAYLPVMVLHRYLRRAISFIRARCDSQSEGGAQLSSFARSALELK